MAGWNGCKRRQFKPGRRRFSGRWAPEINRAEVAGYRLGGPADNMGASALLPLPEAETWRPLKNADKSRDSAKQPGRTIKMGSGAAGRNFAICSAERFTAAACLIISDQARCCLASLSPFNRHGAAGGQTGR